MENPNPTTDRNPLGNGAPSNGEGAATSCSSLVFLGTDCSGTVPDPMCLLQPSDPPCKVCSQSLWIPPKQNPNDRCNTSLLIDYCPDGGGDHRYVMIDVGKAFREQIILTHEHADAVLGLDDIRAVQPFSPMNDIEPTPIYFTQYAMDSLAMKFPYLVLRKLAHGEEVRCVAQLDWKIIDSDSEKPFMASGLQCRLFHLHYFRISDVLYVMHGEDYVSLGFLFGERSRVAYISDVSHFLTSTEYAIIKDGGGQLDLLILDAVSKTLEAIKRICPKCALLIRMTHDFDHHMDNEFLADWSRREGISVQLVADSLRVSIDL